MTDILRPLPGILAAAQPSLAQLVSLAREGVRTVINLRAPNEQVDFDEAREAKSLGLRYVSIPIAGPQDVGPETAARFSRELEDARSAGDVLVHCASANRAGAMLALDQGLTRNQPVAEALAIGRAGGLTTLEPKIAEILGQQTDLDPGSTS
ncbi:MAG TPA: sulfur transferase domain-containing protein [Burkholderiales bacterium]|nr:sulfur transferase domain-containing protein [Burkholderiales bacterium]